MTIEELQQKISCFDASLRRDCAKIAAETAREYLMEHLDNKTYNTLVESGNLNNSIRAAMIIGELVGGAGNNKKSFYARTHSERRLRYVRPYHRTSSRSKCQYGRGYAYRAWRHQFIGDINVLLDRINKRIDQYICYKQKKHRNKKSKK